jgi:acetyl esterase
MSGLDLRVKVAGALMRVPRAMNIERMSDSSILRQQVRDVPRNRLVNLMFGRPAPDVSVTQQSIDAPLTSIPIRIYAPEGAKADRPVIVYLHGGGWTMGTLGLGDWLCSSVSHLVDAIVVSVGYRLAPVHRFPTAVEDSYAALAWVASNVASIGSTTSRFAVMGDSAGGNLAAAVCLAARDREGPAIRHQALLYPATDLTLSAPSIERNARGPILTRRSMIAFRDHYLGAEGDATHPLASPLLANDLSNLPPALVQTADHDPLRDDGRRYAERLSAAGVRVRLTEYAKSPHGFYSYPSLCRSAPSALAELVLEQRQALHEVP